MWDLQRNGGNVVATTERILSGRGLEVVRAIAVPFIILHNVSCHREVLTRDF